MKYLFLLAAATLAALAASETVPGTPAEIPDLGRIERDLTAITGLQFRRPVPAATMSRDQLKRYIDEQVKENTRPKEIHATEATLKLLGLVPEQFDLKKTTIDLLSEQAEAFYDYHRRKLFLIGTQAGVELEMALAHELGHALADQNFNLKHYMNTRNSNDDEAMARMAVMEGQASWLMAAYASRKITGTIADLTRYFDPSAAVTDQTAASYPVFASAPLYVRESLIFPYAEGMRFEQALYRKDGQRSFSEVFQRAPDSTQQVIHPERYEDGDKPDFPEAPRLPPGYKQILDGTLGEFDFRVLLTAYGSAEEARKISGHLSGATYRTGEDRHTKADLITFAARWDSADSARRFLSLYAAALERKAGACTFSRRTDEDLEGRNRAGFFHVDASGPVVRATEGAPSQLE